MKRVIWASVLLTLGGILLPLVFMSGGVAAGEEPSPSPEPAASPGSEESPSPDPQMSLRDGDTVFTVASGESVTETTMADFLPGVLAAEMPVSFEDQALRAQAVAARTYIMYCTVHENSKHPQADVCTDYSCCMAWLDEPVLRGNWGDEYETNMARIRSAVEDTDGHILTYDSQPILACFHSSSSGKTEDGGELWGDVPYLASVVSPETGDDVPNYVTTVEVSAENFRENILLLYPEAVFGEDPALWLGEAQPDESGRVRSIAVADVSVTGPEMRKLFSLRSTAFSLEYSGGAFVFTVTGYGHGLGLSQYGANVMARKGFTWKEILSHYYPETVLG